MVTVQKVLTSIKVVSEECKTNTVTAQNLHLAFSLMAITNN